MRQYMHQQPLLAPHLPNRSSSAGHRSGVSGRIVSFMLPFRFVMPGGPHSLSIWDLGFSNQISSSDELDQRPAQAPSFGTGKSAAMLGSRAAFAHALFRA